MSNQLFQQNLDDKKGPQPGGPYLIQILFKEPVDMPDKETMTAVIEKHIGSTECFCYDKQMAGFAAQEHIAEFKDGKCPVQLMVMKCDRFKGKGFDAFLMSQMWDCQEDRERIFRECKYQVVATDMLAAALPALERANLDADFLEALAELYPTCEAFYFQNCGKLFLAEDVRSHQIEGSDRFIRFGVNVRFFNIEGTEDMLIPCYSNKGTQIMSVNLILDNETDPVVWRGPVIAGVVTQFWSDVLWDDVDYMFVDMPPGTGDVPLTVFQSIPLDGVVVVSTPQDLVGMIVRKAVNMANMMNIPVLGLVENMSYALCPDCGRRIELFGKSKIAQEAAALHLPVLAQLPFDPKAAQLCDEGSIETVENPLMADAARAVAGQVGL